MDPCSDDDEAGCPITVAVAVSSTMLVVDGGVASWRLDSSMLDSSWIVPVSRPVEDSASDELTADSDDEPTASIQVVDADGDMEVARGASIDAVGACVAGCVSADHPPLADPLLLHRSEPAGAAVDIPVPVSADEPTT